MRLNELKGHESIVVVCRQAAQRDGRAGLRDNGMASTLYNLEGGTMAGARGHEYRRAKISTVG